MSLSTMFSVGLAGLICDFVKVTALDEGLP